MHSTVLPSFPWASLEYISARNARKEKVVGDSTEETLNTVIRPRVTAHDLVANFFSGSSLVGTQVPLLPQCCFSRVESPKRELITTIRRLFVELFNMYRNVQKLILMASINNMREHVCVLNSFLFIEDPLYTWIFTDLIVSTPHNDLY